MTAAATMSFDTSRMLTSAGVLTQAFPEAPEYGRGKKEKRATLIIPQGPEPRWIIVGHPRRALPVLRSWRPFLLKSRLQWSSVQWACAAGFLSRLPRVESARLDLDFSYWSERLAGFHDDWQPVLLVGARSHTRKAIVFFLDRASAIRAVCKVPLTQAAGEAILAEASILRHLAWKTTFPNTLFADEERGIAAQTWLEGKPVSRKLSAAHIDLLSSLAEEGAATFLSKHLEPLAAQAAQLDLPMEPAVLRAALSLLEDDTPLPAFVEHRDFAPWNLKRLTDGRLTLLDWEWAVRHSLPWQDVCQFYYMQDICFGDLGNIPELFRNNPLLLDYLQRCRIAPASIPGLTMHYLLRTLFLYWSNEEAEIARYFVRQIQALLAAQH